MARPSKTVSIIQMENRSHRTKAELELRKKGEAASTSGRTIRERKEVKDDPVAHEEFKRVKKILQSIDKDDAGYEAVINRYAELFSECRALIERKEKLLEWEKEIEESEADAVERMKLVMQVEAQISKCETQLQQKRNMMFSIEKENLMTIASQLRTIPKQPKEELSPLAKALRDG